MMDRNATEQPLQEPSYVKPWGWYVATDYSALQLGGYAQNDYLHDDLTIQLSTRGTNSTGYFPTEENAKKAIEDYKAKWNSPTAKQITNHEKAFERAMRGV